MVLPLSSSSISTQGFVGSREELETSVLCPALHAACCSQQSCCCCSSCPAVRKCGVVQIIPPQCLSFPCSVGTLIPVPLQWGDEKHPWSTDINMSSDISPLLADLVLAGFFFKNSFVWLFLKTGRSLTCGVTLDCSCHSPAVLFSSLINKDNSF